MNAGFATMISGFALTVVTTCPAMAQAPSQAERESDAADQGIGDIVVTAQRREERLQDVPIAVQAVTGADSKLLGVDGSTSLQAIVPSLDFRVQNGGATPYIRGIGASTSLVGNESPVAVYIDGVYQTSLSASVFSFSNLERVEVLKGPQGTLFGRNASGGVLNIVTRTPSFTPILDAQLGYGNYDRIEGSVYGSTGLSENVAIDLGTSVRRFGNGYSKNTSRDLYRPREFDARSNLLVNAGPNTALRLAGSYSKVTGSHVALVLAPGSLGLDGRGSDGFYSPRGTGPEEASNEHWSVSGKLNHGMGDVELVSISAYQWTRGTAKIDFDATPLPILDTDRISTAHSFTQELQLLSKGSSSFQWILGAFYLRASDRTDRSRLTGAVVAPLAFLDRIGGQTTSSLAGFAQGSYELAVDTNVTVGLRYTSDKRRVEGNNLTPAGPGPTIVNSRRDNKATWRFALDHHFSEDVMGYGSISRGFKSGFYNTVAPRDPAVLPEVLDAYEVGLKNTLFDNRLRVNLSAFLYKYKNIQLNSFQSGVVVTLNAARATIKGLELEYDAQPIRNLSLKGGVTFLDGKYDSFPGAPRYTVRPTGGNIQSIGDASGEDTVRTPKFVATVNAIYKVPTKSGDFALAASYTHNSGYDYYVLSNTHQSAFDVVNASLQWTAPNQRYFGRIWARNLFSEEYTQSITAATVGDIAQPSEPRTFGVTLGLHL
ncbi:TonB-dependent receptor [Sphingobium sp.]|uniref:TonB-dependent receptor n=1 Tax=Sphingobium sp. TaxID=1912891 RepID=UPI0028BF0C45|nr:TonB-dependent receptor [Sphingobium sp.]